MKKIIMLFFVLSLVVLSANLMAQERKKGEISFGGGVVFEEGNSSPFGVVSLGSASKFIGAEVNAGYIEGVVVIGGNLLVGKFESKNLVPYVTGGVWTTTFGGFGFNVGGGLKIKLSEVFAIRAEYRRYFTGEDWGLNALIGGISLFF